MKRKEKRKRYGFLKNKMSLEVNITKKLNEYQLKADFKIQDENVALLGASGSGKSMLLKCIAGIETPDSGRIVLNHRVLFDHQKKINVKPQQRKVGYLFQNYALFPHFTVKENIACVLKKKEPAFLKQLLKRFELETIEHCYAKELSGGQQQRVALARLLAFRPEILFLDEPFSALDTFLKEKVEIEMKDFLQEFQGESILVTHNRNEAYRLCKELLIIDHGKIVEQGQLKQIFSKPKYLATSKLTGCKNFSKIKKIDDRHLKALDWNVCLKTAEKIEDTATHIGIRAHDFFEVNQKITNAFPVQLKEIAETPFETQYLCLPENSKEILWVKRDKSLKKQSFTPYIAVKPEHIQILHS